MRQFKKALFLFWTLADELRPMNHTPTHKHAIV
jgi:hypothetical protein